LIDADTLRFHQLIAGICALVQLNLVCCALIVGGLYTCLIRPAVEDGISPARWECAVESTMSSCCCRWCTTADDDTARCSGDVERW